ncbi:MAG: hypothetical protein QM485_16350 [Flavobacteriaceae bacterium]
MKEIKIKFLIVGVMMIVSTVSFSQKPFDVQSVGINVSYKMVFGFVSIPENLPLWTQAFSKADNKSAVMVTPNGEMPIKMETVVSEKLGTVDWIMTMPDGSIGRAFSRITKNGEGVIYSFVLMAPPVPMEQLEGTLATQKKLLADELIGLKNLLESKE